MRVDVSRTPPVLLLLGGEGVVHLERRRRVATTAVLSQLLLPQLPLLLLLAPQLLLVNQVVVDGRLELRLVGLQGVRGLQQRVPGIQGHGPVPLSGREREVGVLPARHLGEGALVRDDARRPCLHLTLSRRRLSPQLCQRAVLPRLPG